MRKIIDWIGTDGLLHIMACFGIAAALGNYTNAGLAFFIAVFVGVAKEIIYDAKLKKGTFEWKDIICDIMGASAALIVLLPKLLI